MQTVYEAYKQIWQKEGITKTNEHLEHYFTRSMKIPSLIIENTIHLCFIFPGDAYDYQVNVTAKIV